MYRVQWAAQKYQQAQYTEQQGARFDAARIPPAVQHFPLRLWCVFMMQHTWQLTESKKPCLLRVKDPA